MNNKKTIKRALISSLLSLVLCVSMLIGTTFAWFTDSATSGSNIIQSGKLDVALVDADGNSLEGEMIEWDAFDDRAQNAILWEPGCTYNSEEFYVENKGNLNLKFKVVINGIDGDAKLLEAIDFTAGVEDYEVTVEHPWGMYTTTTDIDLINGTVIDNPLGESYTINEYILEPGEKMGPIVLSGHMKEEAGNEYQDLTIDSVSVSVIATQAVGEQDSYDGVYDKNAQYPEITVVSNAGDLADALANGKDAVLSDDIVDAPVNTKAPYGNYYGVALNGGVLDGNGNSLDFNEGELNNGSLDNYGIMVSAGTIKNVDITGVFRGIVIMNPADDIYIDNVTIGGEDVCYAINTAEGDGSHSLIVTNSTIAGWNSYGTAISDLSFTNCTFAQGEYYTNVYGRLVKPYVTTVFDSCEFNSKYYIDLSALEDGCTITLKDCTVNGVELTAENWKELIVEESACSEGQISIELKDGTYLTASNLANYVIIQ